MGAKVLKFWSEVLPIGSRKIGEEHGSAEEATPIQLLQLGVSSVVHAPEELCKVLVILALFGWEERLFEFNLYAVFIGKLPHGSGNVVVRKQLAPGIEIQFKEILRAACVKLCCFQDAA